MSSIIMNTADVIERCKFCIEYINQARIEEDKALVDSTVRMYKRSNEFWNKITLGFVKILPEEKLKEKARLSMWDPPFYPSRIYSRRKYKADKLYNLANTCLGSDTMVIDSEDAEVFSMMTWEDR